jgi:hypothetical protein
VSSLLLKRGRHCAGREGEACADRPGSESGAKVWDGFSRNLGDRAATLAAVPAGANPAGGNCPVATVVISGDGEGDRTVESPEVKVSERETSNSAGCSKGEPVSPEMVDVGSAEPLGSLGEGKCSSRRNWVQAATGSPGTQRATCWEGTMQ